MLKNIIIILIPIAVIAFSITLMNQKKDSSITALQDKIESDLNSSQESSISDKKMNSSPTAEEKIAASKEAQKKNATQPNKIESASLNNSTSPKNSNAPQFDNKTALKPQELDSIKKMAANMAEASETTHKPESFIKNLQDAGLGPIVGKDFNEDTGKMIIVRTKNTIPGIRYVHAQYFEDENKVQFLQHMSFEIRPAPDAMEKALDILKNMKKNLSKPKISENFIEMSDEDGNSIWLKKLNLADIQRLKKEDPHNAYTDNDVGTIQAAIEQSPH